MTNKKKRKANDVISDYDSGMWIGNTESNL